MNRLPAGLLSMRLLLTGVAVGLAAVWLLTVGPGEAAEPARGDFDLVARLWGLPARSPAADWEASGEWPRLLVDGSVLVVQDPSEVRALDLHTGRAAWPVDDQDSGSLINDESIAGSRPMKGERSAFPGVIQAGVWYGIIQDRLVMLDLQQEGKLLWAGSATELIGGVDASGRFGGAPVVVPSGVAVPLWRGHSVPVLEVIVCGPAGQILWRSEVSGLSSNSGPESLRSLVVGVNAQGVLVWNCGGEDVVGQDAASGVVLWRQRITEHGARSGSAGGSIDIAAEGDRVLALSGGELLCLQERTGDILWRCELAEPVERVLGVAQGCVVVSGGALWGIAVESGTVRWQIPGQAAGEGPVGRGLVQEGVVLWPSGRGIRMVQADSGRVLQWMSPQVLGGQGAGHLLLAGDVLLLAGPQGVVACRVAPLVTGQ